MKRCDFLLSNYFSFRVRSGTLTNYYTPNQAKSQMQRQKKAHVSQNNFKTQISNPNLIFLFALLNISTFFLKRKWRKKSPARTGTGRISNLAS
jgi:hypothetical protein